MKGLLVSVPPWEVEEMHLWQVVGIHPLIHLEAWINPLYTVATIAWTATWAVSLDLATEIVPWIMVLCLVIRLYKMPSWKEGHHREISACLLLHSVFHHHCWTPSIPLLPRFIIPTQWRIVLVNKGIKKNHSWLCIHLFIGWSTSDFNYTLFLWDND